MLFDIYPIFPFPGDSTVEPYADKQYTLPFYKFLDETDPYIYPEECQFKTLFPANYNEVIKAAISEEFYYRQVGQSVPQKFLRRFHRLLNERQSAWVKLVESESVVTPEQATKNYDMYEERSQNLSSKNQGTSESTANSTNNDTVTSKTSSNATAWVSDTPDGSVSDIETYMSSANKNDNSSNDESTSIGTNTNTGSSSSTGSSSGELSENIHRYGNIGVTTFEKILEGYRKSAAWCAFDEVIFPEVDKLFYGLM